MSTNFSIDLTLREEFGSASSHRLRRQGQVPVVVYGAGQDNVHYSTNHNSLVHNLAVEAFHSAIIDIKENGKKQGTILREIQMHPHRPQVLHVDLQRVKATEQITLRVPLHFEGDEHAPGIKLSGGILTRLINDVEIQCLPKNLPEYLVVDVSTLEINESVHLSNIDLPADVELTAMLHDADDYAVASITPSKISAAADDEELEADDILETEIESEENE